MRLLEEMTADSLLAGWRAEFPPTPEGRPLEDALGSFRSHRLESLVKQIDPAVTEFKFAASHADASDQRFLHLFGNACQSIERTLTTFVAARVLDRLHGQKAKDYLTETGKQFYSLESGVKKLSRKREFDSEFYGRRLRTLQKMLQEALDQFRAREAAERLTSAPVPVPDNQDTLRWTP